jgi:hypothetical protein
MGYASLYPFQLLRIVYANSSGAFSMGTVAGDNTLGDITTPNYHGTPSYAYLDLIVQVRYDDSGALNGFDDASAGDMALSVDAIAYQTCGAWVSGELQTGANHYAYQQYRIPGTTNLNTYLQPNTTYHVEIRNHQATGNHIHVLNSSVELNLFFNI